MACREVWSASSDLAIGDMTKPQAPAKSVTRWSWMVQAVRGDRVGGIALTVASVVALAWANWPGSHSYLRVWDAMAPWSRPLGLHLSVRDWVNEGLMLGFFAGVGLEIRREVVAGELRSWRRAAVPVLAAVGGMAVPALIYAVWVAGGQGSHGWGIPMATDVAFALGALALLGRGVSARARTFLMTLAVADDILSIIILVIFYSQRISFDWLLGGLGCLVVMTVARLRWQPPGWAILALGMVAWWAMLKAGVEASVIGAAIGALAPRSRSRQEGQAGVVAPGVRRWELRLEPWVNVVVLPVFAVANVGLSFVGSGLGTPVALRIFAAVAVARIIGKPLGITATTWLVRRLGSSSPATRLERRSLLGLGSVAAIGFTVPLLIIRAALPVGPETAGATAGLLAASVIAVGEGALVLRVRRRPKVAHPASRRVPTDGSPA